MAHAVAGRDSALPQDLQEFVSERLMRDIMNGTLAPGTKLSPAKVAQSLGVSHIPVREALIALEAAGHVKRVPRVGFFVADLSPDYIEDVYHWRQVLEDEACRVALPKITDADIARMRKLDVAATRAAESRSVRYVQLNREFHFAAFERTGSEILLRFLNHLWDAAERAQGTMTYVRLPRSLGHDQHEGIIDAFEARDIHLINARMAEHRGVTLRAIREMASSQVKPAT